MAGQAKVGGGAAIETRNGGLMRIHFIAVRY